MSKNLQDESTTASEISDIMSKLVKQLESRSIDNFYGSFVQKVLKKVDAGKRNDLTEGFQLFLEA